MVLVATRRKTGVRNSVTTVSGATFSSCAQAATLGSLGGGIVGPIASQQQPASSSEFNRECAHVSWMSALGSRRLQLGLGGAQARPARIARLPKDRLPTR